VGDFGGNPMSEQFLKAKCDYLRTHEMCTMDIDASKCRWKDKDGWCKSTVIDIGD